ncbi:MAG: alpha-ketoacid dehydrogenase subunit beta [Acidobacteria bacterium]|nr:alpha-ketoacid dehydrogenase subunit beta [Acidobacteriota bacterium]
MAGSKTVSQAEPEISQDAQRVITYAEAGVEALQEEMRRDPSIFYIGQGIGPRGGNFQQSRGLWAEFGGDRVRDTPIAERAQAGLGVGAALAGSHPVVDIVFLDFVLEAICEIIQQASTIHYISDGKFKVPLVIRAAGGGVRSTGPHHSHTFYSFFMHIPGLKVALPSTPYDVKGLMKTALRDQNPVVFIDHKGLYGVKGPVPKEEYLIPFGKAAIKRTGEHVTIVALSQMVHRALQAATLLEKQGISAEVIDPRTLAPFDSETILTSVAKTGRLVIVDEAYAACGVSAEIAAIVATQALYDLDSPIHRICALPAPHAFSPSLDNYLIPSVDRIVSEVARVAKDRS